MNELTEKYDKIGWFMACFGTEDPGRAIVQARTQYRQLQTRHMNIQPDIGPITDSMLAAWDK